MTKIFSDPFATYGAIADTTASGWSATDCTYNASGGRFTGHGSVVAQSSAQLTRGFAAIAGGDSVFVQWALKWTAGVRGTASNILRCRNNGGIDDCMLVQRLPNDAIRVLAADGATIAGTSAGGVLISDIWHVICVKAKIGDGATGTCDVYVNNMSTPVLSLTGLDLNGAGAASGCDYVAFLCGNGPADNVAGHLWSMSEPFIWSSTGGGVWGSAIGDKRHMSLLPTAEGGTIGWTPLSGTDNALMVDDPLAALHDSDTTYVSTAVAAVYDELTMENTPTGTTGVIGLLSMLTHKKSDGGAEPGTLNHRINSSGTASVIAAAAETTSYVNDFQQFDLNPNGSIAWTKTTVDAVLGGYSIP